VAPEPTTIASNGSLGETIWSIHRKYTARRLIQERNFETGGAADPLFGSA
jgi:hypothetical protein